MMILTELELQLNNIDYEDIYDNINDYEYPYNHINREMIQLCLIKKNIISVLSLRLFSE